MAILEEAIFNRLRTFSAASAVFSGRIYAVLVPQDEATPCLSYHRVGADRFQGHDQTVGLARAFFRFNCFGSTYQQAKDGANAVRKTWDAFRGTVASVVIDGALAGSDTDLFEDTVNVRMYQTNIEVTFWHKEETL